MSILRNLSVALTLMLSSFSTQATVIDLYQWVFNINGTIYESGFYPVGSESLPEPFSGTLDTSGLGFLSTEITEAGDYSFVAMLDYEIDEVDNTFFNEYGSTGGTLAAGQTWEIDEPGWTSGDLYWNVLDAILDNSNNVPDGLNDDVSFALGWDFTLAEGQTAIIDIFMSEMLGTTGFYLAQSDAETGAGYDELTNIFFWSDISITGSPSSTNNTTSNTSVPEPSVIVLIGIGLLGLVVTRRRHTV
ncbi:MAG: PEP-CTERM sorting domain-containing protein [Gammaproteobacteria bacterium]|nr:PEP-CTERM sorting domain-containing protein [Gammaproteobacteria bacterium]